MARPDDSPLRIDRWMTLSVVRRLSPLRATDRQAAIPILMYHAIADDVDDTLHPYFRTVTRPATFARQVALMQRAGYRAVTLAQAAGLLERPDAGCGDAAKTVVLTFDDGFRDFYTTAFPVLRDAGFAATVFVSSDFVGKPFVTGRDCLRAAEVRELSAAGIEFGSHSASHRLLVDLPLDELIDEVSTSKQVIEDLSGSAVTSFSYPYRFPEENLGFTRSLGALLDHHGYRAGVTTAIGRSCASSDRRFLPRLPINDCDDDLLLRAKLDGHYDWLHAGQLMRKRLRALRRPRLPA
jgi:peptidoglycan/xylan/chitin deacetylase (PgdA/CDA1 family)